MSYYGQGDYYGQGGPFDFIKKAVGTVARGAVGFATGGVGGAIAAVMPRPRASSGITNPVMPTFRVPTFGGGGGGGGVTVNPMAILPGGDPFLEFGRKKRRTTNYGNIKALRRAVRRQDGFVRAVRGSLKHTNYQLVTKGSRRGKRSGGNTFIETGAGGIRA